MVLEILRKKTKDLSQDADLWTEMCTRAESLCANHWTATFGNYQFSDYLFYYKKERHFVDCSYGNFPVWHLLESRDLFATCPECVYAHSTVFTTIV
jgi:hypothetical protein